MALIVALVLLVIYLLSPLVGKIALLFVNTVLPDPIPYIDEIIMWLGLLQHLERALYIAEFINEHKETIKKVAIIIGAIILLLVFLVIVF